MMMMMTSTNGRNTKLSLHDVKYIQRQTPQLTKQQIKHSR